MKKITRNIINDENTPERLVTIVTFIISLAIYALTLAPTVTGEDSGELISAAYGFGVAHPPGYPLWTMLAGIFTNIFPFGTVALRANLLSAILSSLSAAVLCAILHRFFEVRRLTALFGSVCFACGLHLWSQAVIAEVYTLHILLVCLILYFILLWRQSQTDRHLYITALITGLAFSNHHLAVLTPPFLLAVVVLCKPKTFCKPKTVILCIVFFCMGLLPYFYLMLAAKTDPYMNWGNPDSWQRLTDHVLRKQYGDESMQMPHTFKRIFEHVKTLWQWNRQQYTLWAMPFMGIGIAYLAVKKRLMLVLTLIFFLLHSIVLAEILNFSFDRQELFCVRVFMLPCYIITAIWLTLGCNLIEKFITCRIKDRSLSSFIGAIPAITIAAIVIAGNYGQNNMSSYYYAEDHALNILNTLEKDAIIIPSGDHNTFPLTYKHDVEKIRPDIAIADKYGYIEYDLYKSMPDAPVKIRSIQQREEIEAYLVQHSARAVYYNVKPNLNLLPDYRAIPIGMLYKICRKTETSSPPEDLKYSYRNIDDKQSTMDHAASVILSEYYFYLASDSLRQNKVSKAFDHIQKTAELSDGLKEEMNNLGTLLAEHDLPADAIFYFEQAAKLDNKYLTPRWNLARLFKAKEDLLHSIQVFNDLANIDPENFRIYGELGFLLFQNGNIDLAVKNWGKSLSLNPDQPQIIEAFAKVVPPEINIEQAVPPSLSPIPAIPTQEEIVGSIPEIMPK